VGCGNSLQIFEVCNYAIKELNVLSTIFNNFQFEFERSLDVRFCWEVTDFGIQGLCLDYIEKESDEDNQTAKAGDFERWESCEPPRLCNSLQKLCLDATQVTKKGIQEALQKLRFLKTLEHYYTGKVLGEMHRAEWEISEKRNKIPKYALTKINFILKNNQISIDRLLKAVSQCPSITELNILGESVILFGDAFDNQQFTFDGVIIPILNVIGNALKEFSLYSFESFDLDTIVDYCPNLSKLELSYICNYVTNFIGDKEEYSNGIQERKKFEKLQEVTLDSVKISRKDLCTLMSSSSLKSIVLKKCETFNDDVLQQAFDLHSFPNLEYLELKECDFVTERGINLLLKERTQLKKIKIISRKGKSLTKEKVEVWNLQISLKNWQLDIEFDDQFSFFEDSMIHDRIHS
jgi:hypothetical protein